ncbi:MAG: hypothetical protein ACFFBD_07725 [Candidatus Hodarchaeota archaeon]
MPDFLTHLMFGTALALVWRPQNREEGMLIILGAVLIDIERPFTLLLMNIPDLYWLSLVLPFHSPLSSLCLAFAASSCFKMDQADFWSRFKLIEGGCVLHLCLDYTMYVWEEMGFFPLYPIKIPFSFHLVWPGFFWAPLGIIALISAGGWWWVTNNTRLCKIRPQHPYKE